MCGVVAILNILLGGKVPRHVLVTSAWGQVPKRKPQITVTHRANEANKQSRWEKLPSLIKILSVHLTQKTLPHAPGCGSWLNAQTAALEQEQE